MKIKKSKDNLIPRQILPKIFSWLSEKEIIVINGPRQAGKTTLLFQIKEKLKKEKVVYVNFEDSFQLEAFLKSPKDFVSLQLAKNKKTYFLFDEFQYVKNGGKILKLLFDQFFEKAKFIITGSSSLQIKEIASYLVGRAIFFYLYPLAFSEFLLAKDELFFKQWQIFNKNLYSFLLGEKFSKTSFIFEEKLKNY
jgi:Predicted ATPase (AAA+ superfamily)